MNPEDETLPYPHPNQPHYSTTQGQAGNNLDICLVLSITTHNLFYIPINDLTEFRLLFHASVIVLTRFCLFRQFHKYWT